MSDWLCSSLRSIRTQPDTCKRQPCWLRLAEGVAGDRFAVRMDSSIASLPMQSGSIEPIGGSARRGETMTKGFAGGAKYQAASRIIFQRVEDNSFHLGESPRRGGTIAKGVYRFVNPTSENILTAFAGSGHSQVRPIGSRSRRRSLYRRITPL